MQDDNKECERASQDPARLAVDLHEAGRMMAVHHRTVLREIRRGKLRGLKIGRLWRVRVGEIEAYLKREEELASP